MADTMRDRTPLEHFKAAFQALGDDRVILAAEALRDILENEEVEELVEELGGTMNEE